MKNLLAVAVSIFIVGSAAFADVRLQLDIRPLGRTLGGGGEHRGVILNADGTAVYYESSVEQPLKNKHVVVAQVSPEEMARVEAMIDAARSGSTEDIVEFCEAIPMQHLTYTADNGTVALMSGAQPCGGRTENQAPEAKELVIYLNRFLHARN